MRPESQIPPESERRAGAEDCGTDEPREARREGEAAAVEDREHESACSGDRDEHASDAVHDEADPPGSLILPRGRPDAHGRLRDREDERANEGG
jgi:hypothetical protein